ncbi:Hypothetical Protein CGB_A0220C [Cryptococcus gattii WM276]|uniref:Uncharacterized protein n=1 Tax=Cryptococcus gattii serotype B (strain WM276 / ATCC MYA-4071) TaxID=367775 RepID=E6QYX5_CRYGW|nr:Hypothetical Protein CGB_A0220C [Cryptococcus gattii WM276]ADV19363.1 Hypothetical Protein CGB_A0220C [Cryptococcus gattii WM276]
MNQTNNSQAGSGRRRKSLPSRLPEDVYNTRMRDLLELEPPPSGEKWDRYYSTALNRLWLPKFLWEACYTVELGWNLERCVRTRTLDPPNLPVYVAIDLVPELPLSLVLSATMRTPYSETKVKAAVDKWMPKWETAEEQEEDDGDWVASSKASGMSQGGFNYWLETLRQAEKPTDIPSNGESPPIPTIEDMADLAMDSNEYQELRIANIPGDLGVHFVSVSSAQMDELFS